MISLVKIVLILNFSALVYSNKVIELSEKFLEIYKNTSKPWLVKFYSQSCYQCKKLEAGYMHVAQTTHDEGLNVIVSKVDGYRYGSISRHFNVYNYPTILYIDKNKVIRYENNKYKNDIVDFVRRMVGQQIRVLDSCEQINQLTRKHESAFVYFNLISSIEYNELAKHHITNTWFYLATINCFGFDKDGIYSIKRSRTNTPYITKYDSQMRITLRQWVDFMHHPKFINITSDNLQKLLDTNKMMVIVLVKKYVSIDRFVHPDHRKYLEMFERIAHLFIDDYYLFGWTSEFAMIRNIAINNLEHTPTFLVLNASNLEYYYQTELTNSTQTEIVRYLELIKIGRIVEKNGGNTLMHQLQRKLFVTRYQFSKIYDANPLMTILLVTLPSTIFLVLFCGCLKTWSSDDDEEQEYLLSKQKHHKVD